MFSLSLFLLTTLWIWNWILYLVPPFVSVAAAKAPALTVVIRLHHLPFGWKSKCLTI